MKKIWFLTPILFIAGCGLTNPFSQSTPAQTAAVTPPITFGTTTLTLVTNGSSTTPFPTSTDDLPEFFQPTPNVPFSFSLRTEEQTWKTPSTIVQVTYPVMEYPQHPALAQAFNAALSNRVKSASNAFLQDIGTNWTEESEYARETENEIYVDVILAHATPGFVSLIINESTYYAGAAHTNNVTYSFNFDLNQGKEIPPENLFISHTGYIPKLSALAIAALKVANKDRGVFPLDPEWIKSGAGPNAQNFHTVAFTKTGLLVVFDAGQIDAYASGPTNVTIPYTKLVDILNPDIVLMVE